MKRRYSWLSFQADIKALASRLKNKQFDEIYGIPRGGLIVAVSLSHHLDIPLSLKFHPKKKVLVVDDIADAGKTLEKFSGKNVVLATLFYAPSSTIEPDFWIRKKRSRDWIIFPWETPRTSRYDRTV